MGQPFGVPGLLPLAAWDSAAAGQDDLRPSSPSPSTACSGSGSCSSPPPAWLTGRWQLGFSMLSTNSTRSSMMSARRRSGERCTDARLAMCLQAHPMVTLR